MRHRQWIVAVVLAAAGCASTNPKGQAVPVVSNPPGATAAAGNQRIKTPGTLYAPQGARQMEILIEKEGFESALVILTSDPTSFGDCLDRAASSVSPPPSDPGSPAGPLRPSGAAGSDITGVVFAIAERFLALVAGCEFEAERHQPASVFVTLEPKPLTLRSPRD